MTRERKNKTLPYSTNAIIDRMRLVNPFDAFNEFVVMFSFIIAIIKKSNLSCSFCLSVDILRDNFPKLFNIKCGER